MEQDKAWRVNEAKRVREEPNASTLTPQGLGTSVHFASPEGGSVKASVGLMWVNPSQNQSAAAVERPLQRLRSEVALMLNGIQLMCGTAYRYNQGMPRAGLPAREAGPPCYR
ncbi:hypothetical protein MGG_15384 [Pyricularia oryzae 70-15]|uniref:Uncharacterized protein n=1 Tax=Pyricularia oryzae (strain 70-15 / ATCC MYA-4617 / FGSC 8958) TaxID=242507 RepID=G4NKG4_PYRO7|nr:uncharacterized protein MGG_15384 [Pyricularia oryzae 70-15]EHA46600.1 hypothetical protein MGG_15384 [Pyricularia oryzae 70-15]